ncbi:MAG: alpha/beta fold hydrolase [Chlamydiales bacterium]|nr:alpha/beta fold hydrolase [Chlamydiales bacterium]
MQGTLEKTESREWVAVDNQGVRLFGVLHRPLQKETPPVVLILHGFASSKHGSNRCYVILAEALAKAGIASLRFDFRGSGDSESTLSASSFEDLISDALAFSKHLSSLDKIDTSRMGLFGASLGGAIGVEACGRGAEAKALALWAPVASGELWLRDFIMKQPELIHADPHAILGTYRGIQLTSAFREQFARLFAYKTLASMPHLPFLHMHGEKDETISIAHQEAFQKACTSNAKFIAYPEEQHSLGYAKAFPDVIHETLAFFKEHLA